MAALTLEQLLEITPLEEDIRKDAFARLDTLSDGEKFELEQICWETIADTIQIRTRAKFMEAVQKLADHGGDEAINIEQIEDEVTHEFLSKMEVVRNEDQLEEVKKKIEEMKTQQAQPSPPLTDPNNVN